MNVTSQLLCFAGVLLFLAGLFTGFAIPFCRSARLGLSAHLTGVQSGTFLLAVGLLWPRLTVPAPWDAVLANSVWASLYLIWLALLLAGIFGAGRGLPIAGQGVTTSAARQTLVTALMATGSLVLVVAVTAVLAAFRWG